MEYSLNDFQEFLESVRIPVRLSCKTGSDWPVVLSLWYLHQDGKLFCATQKSAKVVSYLQTDPRCGFEIAEDRPPYCGIRGQAIATIDQSLGSTVLEQLLERYLGSKQNSLAEKLLAKRENEVAIILEPVQVFTWNFSDRMKDSFQRNIDLSQKVCP